MQALFREAPPPVSLDDLLGSDSKQAEIFGATRGLTTTAGEQAYILSGCSLTGGGCCSLDGVPCRYLSGTDTHTYVPNTGFDTEVHFARMGDTGPIPCANGYHHYGWLADGVDGKSFDNKFFGYRDTDASTMMPAHNKALGVGCEMLFWAGFTKTTFDGKPILFYPGDCGRKRGLHVWARQMKGEGFKPEMKDVDWDANRALPISGRRRPYNFGPWGPVRVWDTAGLFGLTAFCATTYSTTIPTARGITAPPMDPQLYGALGPGVNMIVADGAYIGGLGSAHALAERADLHF